MLLRVIGRLAVGIAVVCLGGALVIAAYRHVGSLQRVYELDTRLWFLDLKIRGDVPQVGWVEALRRVGPTWRRLERFDLAHPVAQGAPPCTIVWDTPLGRFFGTTRDGRELDLLTLEQAGGDIYERRDVVVRNADVVIDVGAHLGTFTRVALRRGARLVVAVEPNPTNIACLARTFSSEIAAGRVRVVPAAAWHSPGSVRFELDNASQMGHVAPSETAQLREAPSKESITVRAVTLDQIVDDLKLDRVDFIKMDIEGAERHALTGARRVLAAHKPRLAICIYHASDDREVVPRVVAEANATYRTFTRGGFQAFFY